MPPESPFWHYNSTFDAIDMIKRHGAPDLEPTDGLLTNYFGVLVDPAIFPAILAPMAGTVERGTIPANWHADIAEFAAALRAVDLSGPDFTIVELGCGWGCWMNITGAAARRAGRNVHLIGIEGDESHAQWAVQSMHRNGFAPDQFVIHRGIAAATEGVALFPRSDDPSMGWGDAPVFGATPEQQKEALASGSHDVLAMIPIENLTGRSGRIDLLHIDIQGGEADLVEGCMDVLCEMVAYIVIGTHTREIEGRLFGLLKGRGWKLEMDRPLLFDMMADPPTVRVDGVQGWRNPNLLPG